MTLESNNYVERIRNDPVMVVGNEETYDDVCRPWIMEAVTFDTVA